MSAPPAEGAPHALVAIVDRFLLGLTAERDAKPVCEVVDLREALERTYKVDAHASVGVLYDLSGAPVPKQARINKSALPRLAAKGYTLRAAVLFVDVDNPSHAPWTPALREAWESQRASASMLRTCGVYDTKNGLRLVQPLTRLLDADETERALKGWKALLARQGIIADGAEASPVPGACGSVNHLYRLPRVRRERVDQRPKLDLENMIAIDPAPLLAAAPAVEPRRAGSHKRRSRVVVPAADLPDAWLEHVEPVASAMRGRYDGCLHHVGLALSGALLNYHVPAELVTALVQHIARADGRDEPRLTAGAADTVTQWAKGNPTTGRSRLQMLAPELAAVVEARFGGAVLRAEEAHAPEPESIESATAALENYIRSAADGVTLLGAPCGVGKTAAAILIAIEHAAKPHKSDGVHTRSPLGSKTSISVPTHALARDIAKRVGDWQCMRLFAPQSHKGSDGKPTCAYHVAATELAKARQPIAVVLCKSCDRRDGCAAADGIEGPRDARIALGVHGLLPRLIDHAGASGLVVVDEPPDLLASERITAAQIATTIAQLGRFEHDYTTALRPALDALAAVLASDATTVEIGDDVRAAAGPAHETTVPPLKSEHAYAARRSPKFAKALGVAGRVLAVVRDAIFAVGARVDVDDHGDERVIVVTAPDRRLAAAYRRTGRTILLGADVNAHAAAVEHAAGYAPAVHEVHVRDAAPVERMIFTAKANRRTWLPRSGLTTESINHVVEAARAAVVWLLERPTDVGIGIVTFKIIADAMRVALGASIEAPELAGWDDLVAALKPELARLDGRRVEVGHFGALRGRDHWRDLDALVTLGDPWRPVADVAREAEVYGVDAEVREVAYVAAELEQAHGRLRAPRRDRPCRMLHVGRVLPRGWPQDTPRRPLGHVDGGDVRELVLRHVARLGVRGLARRLLVPAARVQRWLAGSTPSPDDLAALQGLD